MFDDGKYINQFEVDSRKKKKKGGLLTELKAAESLSVHLGRSLAKVWVRWVWDERFEFVLQA